MSDKLGGRTLARLQELLDKEDIREQLMRYSRGVDRFDPDVVDSVYWPDAWDEHGPVGTLRGEECSVGLIEATRDMCKAGQHSLGNILIELEGDRAFVESYFLNVLVMDRDGKELTRLFGGRYLDRFERRDGEWRIAHRVVVHDWSRLDEVVEAWPPGATAFIQGERGEGDLVYSIRLGEEAAHARVMALRQSGEAAPIG